MFLRHTKRKKDGKEHRYWSIVENRRIGGGRVVQRPLLYLGEINDSQELAWRKSIAIVEEGSEKGPLLEVSGPCGFQSLPITTLSLWAHQKIRSSQSGMHPAYNQQRLVTVVQDLTAKPAVSTLQIAQNHTQA